jgi:hypothetical protein
VEAGKAWLLNHLLVGLIPDHDDDIMDEVSPIYMSIQNHHSRDIAPSKNEVAVPGYCCRNS